MPITSPLIPTGASSPATATTVPAEGAAQRFVGLTHFSTRGSTIEALQRAVNLLGAGPKLELDGIYGPRTEGAVRDFIAADRPALQRGAGCNGDSQNRAAVRQLQRALAIVTRTNLVADGRFGEKTEAALRAWQRSLGANNPSPEGQVEDATWEALLSGLVDELDSGAAPPRRATQPITPTPGAGAAMQPPTAGGVLTPTRTPTGPVTRAPTGPVTRAPTGPVTRAPTGPVSSAPTGSALPAATASFDPQRAYDTILPQLEAVTSPAEQVNLRDSLRRYVTAYANFTGENPGAVTGKHGLMVNFGARNDTSGRGFILDMENLSLTRGPMPVSHGHGKKTVGHTLTGNGFARTYGGQDAPFSNASGTNKSSLGVYTTFPMSGLHRGQYARVGLNGHSTGFNDKARDREIYMHGVPNNGYRTQGCPGFTMTQRTSADGVRESDNDAVQRLLEGKPSFVFLDAPMPSWHSRDPWLNGGSGASRTDAAATGVATGTFDVRGLGNTVGLRNNNPWNVKSFGTNTWRGETGRDSRNHAQFDNAAFSARAAARQLVRYYDGSSNAAGNRELRTLQQIFSVYAPASDTVGSLAGAAANQPNAYAAWVAGEMGISATEDIGLVNDGNVDREVAVSLLDAIARYENTRDLNLPDGLIEAGLDEL